MKRLLLPLPLVLSLTLAPSAQSKKPAAAAPPPPFTVVEASIPDMRTAMEQGRVTSRELVQQYLMRIATYEDRLNAIVTVNPNALEDRRLARPRARAGQDPRSAARHSGRAQGQHPHDEHADDRRRAGVRRAGAAVRRDADPKNLKDAGAIIIAKTAADRAGQLGGERACRATTTRSPATG